MSRSYKTEPWITDGPHAWAKKHANKRVRRSLNVPNGKAYRKFSCSYDICDYKFLWLEKDNREDDGYVTPRFRAYMK